MRSMFILLALLAGLAANGALAQPPEQSSPEQAADKVAKDTAAQSADKADDQPANEQSTDAAPQPEAEKPAAPSQSQVDPDVLAAEAARVAVVERASRATVAIFARGGAGGGSGVVISPDGYALSNFHVTHEAGIAMKCGMADGKLYDAVIVGLDPTGDVALIKLLGRDDFPAAAMADSDKVQVGDWCFAIGNPFLLATNFQPTVSYGVISGVHRYQYPSGTILEYADCLQADAAINPGNSGGPMFDAEGRLIGINGRGSFEKRGRVNVGVGYAISINQIKNFLGHLKGGRLVDHATLGARLRSDDTRRVLVDDLLDESDAYRRGLRYGDEVVSFGGRDVTTVNGFKNVLGIFPKGWRVPLVFERRGERFEVMVRLRGVNREADLVALLEDGPQIEPEKVPQKPGTPPGTPPGKSKRPLPMPNQGKDKHPSTKSAKLPEIVKQHYEEKPGYINYHFNKLNRDRVWQALSGRSDYSAARGAWTIDGHTNVAEAVTIEFSDTSAAFRLPSGELRVTFEGDLSERREPPGSGGLLVALALWRRMLIDGPEKFGDVSYWGTAPLAGHDRLYDVLVGTHGDVECRFFVDTQDGLLAAVEMWPEEETDPCELVFRDYREVNGVQLPFRIEVTHGDEYRQIIAAKSFNLATEAAKPDAEKAKDGEAKEPADKTPAAEKAEPQTLQAEF